MKIAFALSGCLTALVFLPALSQGQTTAQASVPSVIQEQEGSNSGTWTWNGQDFNASWDNGATAILTVRRFSQDSVVIDRADTQGSPSSGMMAVYTGQISSAGNSIVNGAVTWTHRGASVTGSWTASWSQLTTRPPSLPMGQTTDAYQSSLDGQTYELRKRGEMGLDIYSSGGTIVAVMDKKKANDNFKGKTQRLASRCPDSSGKIETVAVAPDRIQMRIEVASKSLGGQMVCNMLFGSAWQEFDLVKQAQSQNVTGHYSGEITQPGGPVGTSRSMTEGVAQGNATEQQVSTDSGNREYPEPVNNPDSELHAIEPASAPSASQAGRVTLRQVAYQIDSCKREGPSSVSCQGSITNNGQQMRRILLLSEQLGGIRSAVFDQYGITQAIDENAGTHHAARLSLANQASPQEGQFSYDLHPGLRVPLGITFDNFDPGPKSLYSLEIRGTDGAPIVVSFKNLPVSGMAKPVKGVLDIRGISYEISSCTLLVRGQLNCYGSITNTQEQNRKILLISKQWGGMRSTGYDGLGMTKAIDANANEYEAARVWLANQGSPQEGQLLYELLPHLRVGLLIAFQNFDRSAKSLYTLEIHGTDGQPLSAAFPGVPVVDEPSQLKGKGPNAPRK
jgi:hypothetical protein